MQKKTVNKTRNHFVEQYIRRQGAGAGPHKNRPQDDRRCPRKAKHRKALTEE